MCVVCIYLPGIMCTGRACVRWQHGYSKITPLHSLLTAGVQQAAAVCTCGPCGSLGCEEDEGLLVWQVDLAPQQMEVLSWGRYVCNA